MIDPEELAVNKRCLSPSGILFEILHLGSHGQDCSIGMVVYTNLEPTYDYPAGKIWVIAESLFIKQFTLI